MKVILRPLNEQIVCITGASSGPRERRFPAAIQSADDLHNLVNQTKQLEFVHLPAARECARVILTSAGRGHLQGMFDSVQIKTSLRSSLFQ